MDSNREGHELDQKSLRYALGKHADLDGLACDCVAFANAAGRVEIHSRIGAEIPTSKLRRTLQKLVAEGLVATEGARKARKYLLINPGPNPE